MSEFPGENIEVPVQRVTPDDAHYWFGYYDKCPWSANGRFMLAMRSAFADRQPTSKDAISLGLIDLEAGNRFEPFGKSQAWCWQQGCMLQWLPQAPGRLVMYNAREGKKFVTRIQDVMNGEIRTLPRPTYALSKSGKTALSINFSRLAATRPGYGYEGVPDPVGHEAIPESDGIFSMDIESGESRLILSTADAAGFRPEEEMNGVSHWLNHIEFNTDDSRIVFLHRYARQSGQGMLTRMLTVNPDGTNLHMLIDRMASHFAWRDPDHLLCYSRVPGTGGVSEAKTEREFVLFEDQTDRFEIVGKGVLTPSPWADGHCTYSPDRQWILNDTYPDADDRKQTLILYHPESRRRVNIGRFLSPEKFTGALRCDLHPRFNRDGTKVCFDSTHEGRRAVYIADVSAIVG